MKPDSLVSQAFLMIKHMHKFFKIIGLLFIALSFSSCIELVEEIKINPDLSGRYHLYLSNDGLEFLFKAVSQNIDISALERSLQIISHQDGISNFTTAINLKKGIFSIQFDFSDSKKLTKAFYLSLGAEKRFYNKNFLSVNQSRIKRPNLRPYLIKYLKKEDLFAKLPNGKILDYVNYRFKIITPEPIKGAWPKSESEQYRTQEYNKLYTLKTLLDENKSTKIVIRFGK